MVPPAEDSGAEQLEEERAPIIARDGEALLPGQLEDRTPGPIRLAVPDGGPEPNTEGARDSEAREPTPAEESATAEPEAVVAAPRKQDSWEGWHEGDLCAVCQAPCSDTPLNCGHALHPQCLAEWTLSNAEQRGNCPTCRQPLTSRPRSPVDRRNSATTPQIPTLSEFGRTGDAEAPEPTIEANAHSTGTRVNLRKVARYTMRFVVIAFLVVLCILAIFTCTLSVDACCSVECDGGRAARYRYSNGTCVCAEAQWSQASPKCDLWRYPAQRLMRAADSDARCAASALSNRLVKPRDALLGGKRYVLIPTVGATCDAIGLQSLNSTLECESVLRAANNQYSQDSGLGYKALTQVRRGLAENTFRYLYHVEGGQMFNRADAAPGSRKTGWYRKRTPYYSATDCGAATFIDVGDNSGLFHAASHEGDVRANPDNPRYAPTVEWAGFDGPHPIDSGVGLPVDISRGWEFVPPVLNVDRATRGPYARALEAAALQNEAFAQGYVAAIFCVAPHDLQDAPVGGICAQEVLSYLDLFWWFALAPMLVGAAGVMKKRDNDVVAARILLVFFAWLVYMWITAAQCAQGKTGMMHGEIGLATLLLVCAACVCMCRMPCCDNGRRANV